MCKVGIGLGFWNISEVAKRAGVTEQTLHRWVRNGWIAAPTHKAKEGGLRLFYKEQEVVAIVEKVKSLQCK